MLGVPNATALARQAQDFWSVANACWNVDNCVSLVSLNSPIASILLISFSFWDQTTWGVSDDHSWLAPLGNALPFDGEKQPKPAFFALADAFQGRLWSNSTET